MKKLSVGLAAVMMLNTSFAFAKLTPVEVTQIKVQISSEKSENDRIGRAIDDTALKIQALEDIKTPALGAYYREYGRTVLSTTGIAASAGGFLYILATTDGYYMTSTAKPAVVAGVISVAVASIVGALFTQGNDVHDRFMSLKTQFLGLNEQQQADLYVKLHEELNDLGNELAQSDSKIKELKNELKNN